MSVLRRWFCFRWCIVYWFPYCLSGFCVWFLVLIFSTLCPSSLHAPWRRRERAGCFALTAFLMSCDCQFSVALPRGADGWFAMCDCGISWSYSLAVSIEILLRTPSTGQREFYADLCEICWRLKISCKNPPPPPPTHTHTHVFTSEFFGSVHAIFGWSSHFLNLQFMYW